MRNAALAGLLMLVNVGVMAQPIFDYVAAPDPSFEWREVPGTVQPLMGEAARLEMTSQVWQGITWRHRIAVVRPPKVVHPRMCFLLITGGDPGEASVTLGMVAAQLCGMAFATLGDIPNQPLFGDLREDALISYTFVRFLETGDPTWPLLFPMTKSAVRAMDALQAFSEQAWGTRFEGFVVGGGSKRGWTTWFTGEVDQRVKGIVPMVYDNLNLPAQMRLHLEQWGAYSEQIDDYSTKGLPDLLASEEGRELGAMVDPYTYRDRATMPKLIINGANDRYWPLGAANLYFDDLVGPKYLLYVPNAGHGLEDTTRVLKAAAALVASCAGEFAMPEPRWQFAVTDEGLRVTATSDVAPQRVLAWVAQSATTDFRDSVWTSHVVSEAEGTFAFALPVSHLNQAVFLEFDYQVGDREFPLCSQIRMLPRAG